MKKSLLLILMVLFLLSFSGVAIAEEMFNPNLDFEFNEDFTKIKIGEKTYDNLMILMYYADSNELYLENLFTSYLVIPSEGVKSPEEFVEGIKYSMRYLVSTELKEGYDKLDAQIVLVNYKPWLETEYSDDYFDWFKTFNRPDLEANIPKIKSGEWLVSLEEIKDFPIVVREYDLARNDEEFKKASTEYIKLEGANVYNLREVIKNFSLNNFNELKKEDNKEKTSKTSQIILQLNNKEIKIGENTYRLDVAPYNSSGITLIPLRGVLESLNANVEWLETQEIKIKDELNEIVLKINSKTAIVNGEMVNLSEPVSIMNGRTFIPLRFVSENLGYNVEWIPETKNIIIN